MVLNNVGFGIRQETLNCTRQLSLLCRHDVIIYTALVQFQSIYVKAVTVTVIKHLCESQPNVISLIVTNSFIL